MELKENFDPFHLKMHSYGAILLLLFALTQKYLVSKMSSDHEKYKNCHIWLGRLTVFSILIMAIYGILLGKSSNLNGVKIKLRVNWVFLTLEL
jgi:quinol-cytochrome oxidoreductase complex cytochrome b subunit